MKLKLLHLSYNEQVIGFRRLESIKVEPGSKGEKVSCSREVSD